MMDIDVIIPTYNRAHLLERALKSVLNQSYANLNLIIIDDGSSDTTIKILENYQSHPKIKYETTSNQGVSAARNTGIKLSGSKWIAFLDSDDEWLPHKLETQVRFLSQNTHLRMIHSNEIWIRNGARVNAKKKFDKSGEDFFKRSLERCLISPSTVIMRRDLLEENNLFDESYPICEDYDLWLKVISQEEIGFSPDNLIYKYGGHEDQLSTRYPAMDFWRVKSMVKLLEEYNLPTQKKDLVINEVKLKSSILLQGYIKHNNSEQHRLLSEMIKNWVS